MGSTDMIHSLKLTMDNLNDSQKPFFCWGKTYHCLDFLVDEIMKCSMHVSFNQNKFRYLLSKFERI